MDFIVLQQAVNFAAVGANWLSILVVGAILLIIGIVLRYVVPTADKAIQAIFTALVVVGAIMVIIGIILLAVSVAV